MPSLARERLGVSLLKRAHAENEESDQNESWEHLRERESKFHNRRKRSNSEEKEQ